MFNTRIILLALTVFVCFVSQTTSQIQYPNIDEDTGCPIGVAHVCDFCAVDQNRLGCYCELPNGDELVTTNIFTACPSPTADPCATNPCQNGGTCIQQGLSGYKCECPAGQAGAVCNETLPKCADAGIDCLNAECVETTNSALPVYCQCYDGTRRDPRQNSTCPLSPCFEPDTETPVCKNNGTCRIVNNVHLCECRGGWAGQNCTKALKTPLCQDKPGVCGVGTCIQSLSPPFYTCSCGNHPSTFGKTIGELVKCELSGCYASNPCQNGGTCSNKGENAFVCQCPARFTGSKCEKQSACFNNPCVNGGTCEALNETVYFCKCPPYFTGQRCEITVPDPCKTKNCGPYGICRDINGVAVCECNDGKHLDGSPCSDPCINKTCGPGVCSKAANATNQAICLCPVTRKGDRCENPTDVCRENPRCGGGYCKPNYTTARGFVCVCENGVVKTDPCPFSTKCPIKDCGPDGVCVETDGITVIPGGKPIYYVCQCRDGYIASGDCTSVLGAGKTAATASCGSNGKPYPSRNPTNPFGCWCNNGTHVEEIKDDAAKPICI